MSTIIDNSITIYEAQLTQKSLSNKAPFLLTAANSIHITKLNMS